MQRELILCPETGYLEELDYERTELGVLVERCTRQVRCGECARLCAVRMDIQNRGGERRDSEPETFDDELTGEWTLPAAAD